MATSQVKLYFIMFIILSIFATKALSASECEEETSNSCNNKEKALPLKIIAIVSILLASVIGVCAPLFTRAVPALNPEKDLFTIVLHPLSAVVTLMVDSMATSVYSRKFKGTGGGSITPENGVDHRDQEMAMETFGHGPGHHHGGGKTLDGPDSKLMRNRVIAMVLELGIVVHSVVIGLSLGASSNTCSIKGLIAALCFHQMFEGMGLGGCILQAEYKWLKKAIMVFFFSVTTPFGIAVGIGLSNTYKENSPVALVTVGLLNASSAGLLIYMALVDLLAVDFMGPKLQASVKLQIKSFVAVLLGAGLMSLMAKWA
ncbi:hypothetical protein ACFE04_014126 [Oxalis oulophora]